MSVTTYDRSTGDGRGPPQRPAPGLAPRQQASSGWHAPSRLALFRLALAGRDRFPSARLQSFARLSRAELAAAVHNTRAVERRIRADWRRRRARGEGLGQLLAALDLELVSCDHGWREIFVALTGLPERFEAVRRAALEAYLRYLNSRYRALSALQAGCASGLEPAAAHGVPPGRDAQARTPSR